MRPSLRLLGASLMAVFVAPLFVRTPAAVNCSLLANGGFEESAEAPPAGWQALGCSTEVVTAPLQEGTRALRVTTPAAGYVAQVLAAEGGASYSGTGWALLDGQGQAYLEVRWYASLDGTGPALASAQGAPVTSAPTFTQLSLATIAPAGARSLRFKVVLEASEPNVALIVDSVSLEGPCPSATATATPTSEAGTPTSTPTRTPSPRPTATNTPTPVPTSTPKPAVELLGDGGLEGAAPWGWTVERGTLEAVGSPVYGGAQAGRLTCSGSDWARIWRIVPLTYGTASFSAQVRAETGGASLALEAAYYASDDGTGQRLLTGSSPLLEPDHQYQSLATGAGAIPSGARSVRLSALLFGEGASVYLDDLSLLFWESAPPPPPPPVGDDMRLSEVLAAPREVDWNGDGATEAGGDEWIELRNRGRSAADAGGWVLVEGSRRYAIPAGTEVTPGGYAVLFGSETGLKLNNDGDAVLLLRPDGSVADSMDYPSARYDQAWARLPAGGWAQTSIPTPGSANVFPPGEATGPVDTAAAFARLAPLAQPIAAVRELPVQSKAVVIGRVTAEPETLADRVMYLEDETGGIRVYMRHGDYPELFEGQRVLAQGEVWVTRG